MDTIRGKALVKLIFAAERGGSLTELAAAGFEAVSAEVEKVPSTYVTLTNEDDIVKMNRLLEMLEDNEDVINVWHNWENCDE